MDRERKMWNKILGNPLDCIYCIQVTRRECPQLRQDTVRFCYYWMRHPDGKEHPICCLGICEYFERKNKGKETVEQTPSS